MKVAVLFSGGKDSCYALHLVLKQGLEVTCLLAMLPEKPDSYMFHYPNIRLVEHQAKLINIPLLKKETKAEKEKELEDLKALLVEAKERYSIEGVVSGAIASNYQKTRIDKICGELGLEPIAPLWGKNQEQLLKEEVKAGLEIMIVGVYAEGLDESWLGKEIDEKTIQELSGKKFLSPVGEGGEFETITVNGPMFKKKLEVIEKNRKWDGVRGELELGIRE